MPNPKQNDDSDSPWKEILERFFPEFMQFFFPQAYLDINWKRRHEFLDKELQQVVRQAKLGKRLVDKLVKVWLKDGKQIWVLIHIEIQGKRELTFAERIYIYNYRLYDRYHHKVASFVILTDGNKEWRPSEFSYQLWDCAVNLKFSTVKLLDFKSQRECLEQSNNPFAIVVMAHLQMQATKKNRQQRLNSKLNLAKQLYKKGYSKQEIIGLFKFIDWIMVLPAELEQQFQQRIYEYGEGLKMPFVNTIESMGIEKGLKQGLEQGLEQGLKESIKDVLEVRFEEVTPQILAKVNKIKDVKQLRDLHRKALEVTSIAEFETLLSQ